MFALIFSSALRKVLAARNTPAAVQKRESACDSPLQGMRFQLLRALGVLERGHMAILRVEQPLRAGRGAAGGDAQAIPMSDNAFAEPLWVPGTMYPAPVGEALLALGWIKPAAREHWIPSLRFFEISESGRRNLRRARVWWSQLGPLQKLAAMVAE